MKTPPDATQRVPILHHPTTEPQRSATPSQLSSCLPSRVTVLTPRGGETVTVGQHVLIRWHTSCYAGLVFHQVQLSTDGGITYPRNISPLLDGKGLHYLWTPTDDVVTHAARIRVMAINWGEAASDGSFLIQSASG